MLTIAQPARPPSASRWSQERFARLRDIGHHPGGHRNSRREQQAETPRPEYLPLRLGSPVDHATQCKHRLSRTRHSAARRTLSSLMGAGGGLSVSSNPALLRPNRPLLKSLTFTDDSLATKPTSVEPIERHSVAVAPVLSLSAMPAKCG